MTNTAAEAALSALNAERVSLDLPLRQGTIPLDLHCSAIRELIPQLDDTRGYVFGLLMGTRTRDRICIQGWRASPAQGQQSPAQSQTAVLRMLDEAASQAVGEPGPRPIGLFRTQPGGWPAITERDKPWLEAATPSLPEDGGLFVVIRNLVNRPRSASVFSLDPSWRARNAAPVMEFPFDDYLLRNGYFGDVPVPTEAGIPQPPLLRRPARAPNRWMLLAGAGALAVAAGALYLWNSGGLWNSAQPPGASQTNNAELAASPPGTVALSITRRGSDIDINWDRTSPIVQNAVGGSLLIRDGSASRAVRLTALQLREGHILYQPLSGGDQDFQLQVETKDGQRHTESVQVLSWSSASGADRLAGGAPPSGSMGGVMRMPPVSTPPKTRSGASPPAAESKPATRKEEPANVPAQARVQTEIQTQPVPVLPPEWLIRSAQQSRIPATPAGGASPNPQGSSAPAAPPPPITRPAIQPAPQPAVTPPQTQAASNIPVTTTTGPVPTERILPVMTSQVRDAQRRANGKVTVSVRVKVSAEGRVANAEVISIDREIGAGGLFLRSAALNAARYWKFKPATVNGTAVPGDLVIAFTF